MGHRFPTYFEIRSSVDGRLVGEALFRGLARRFVERHEKMKGERLHFREVHR